ncbi:MAG: radical SAM protein, partial [Deltaproteobacteria bacterium]|nr:radical SAM protein [Deltaproteobacteria bacterium]
MTKGHPQNRSNLRLVAWEVTRSCNLNCVHCRAASDRGPYPGEMDPGKSIEILDQIALIGKPIVIITGGEPLLRKDIFDLARDGADAKAHDEFRKVPGAFKAALEGIDLLKKAKIEFQINTTVTRHNVHQVEEILNRTMKLGAVAHHIFLLVPTGRARDMVNQEIDSLEYEKLLRWFYHIRDKVPLHLKATCAPHYYRILRQEAHAKGEKVDYKAYGLDAVTRGCLGGTSFCFISHDGM